MKEDELRQSDLAEESSSRQRCGSPTVTGPRGFASEFLEGFVVGGSFGGGSFQAPC